VFPASVVGGQGAGGSKTVSTPDAQRPTPGGQRPTAKTGVVYVQKEGRFWPKTVTLGRRNDVYVLVTKGVQAGDVLAEHVPPASLIGPATREEQQAWAVRLFELLPWGVGR
jgi:hypothetical protein